MVTKKTISPDNINVIQPSLSDGQIQLISDLIVERIIERNCIEISKKEILTPTEVEKLLDISHTTRIEWTRQGVLRSYKITGRKIFYKYSEIMSAMIPIVNE